MAHGSGAALTGAVVAARVAAQLPVAVPITEARRWDRQTGKATNEPPDPIGGVAIVRTAVPGGTPIGPGAEWVRQKLQVPLGLVAPACQPGPESPGYV